MADKSWISKLNPFTSKSNVDPEVKALTAKLDAVMGERDDISNWDAKFFDVDPSSFNGNGSDYSVGTDQALDVASLQRLYTSETWVYVAVNAIAKTIAALPLRLEKKQTIKKTLKNKVTGETETIEQDVWIDASGEKLNARFQYPNPFLSKAEFFMMLTIDLLTAGEYFVYLASDQDLDKLVEQYGEVNPADPFNRLRAAMAIDTPVKAMYRIPPSVIKPVPSVDRSYIEGYMVQADHGVYLYHWAEIVHVKLPNPCSPYCGLSPISAAAKPVLMDRFSAEHVIRFYKSGARLGGVIQTEKDLNKEQLARFQRSFEGSYTGRDNHHRTLILPPGMKYNIISANPAETALLDFCAYNREAILSTFNVPPVKVGVMDKANYANALVQMKLFFTDTIMPFLTFIEDGFNLKPSLMPATGMYRIKFDLSDVEALRQNQKDSAEAAKFMIGAGMTINEVRERVWNLPPIPGGDKCQTVEQIKEGKAGAGGGGMGLFGASAEPGEQKQQLPDNVQADSTVIDPAHPTKVSFTERVAVLTAQFVAQGVPVVQAVAQAIEQARAEGFNDETDPDPQGPPGGAPKPDTEADDAKDGAPQTGLGTQQNSQIIPRDVAGDPKHPEDCDCDKCKEERESKKGGEQTLAEFLHDAISKLNDGEEVTPEFLNQLVEIYKETHKEAVTAKESAVAETTADVTPETAPDQGDIQAASQVYAFGMSKEAVVGTWKSFVDNCDPMIERRKAGVKTFFKACERLVLNRLGANLKAYGLHKSRNSDDVNEILSIEAFQQLIKEYIADADKQLLEAFKYGFNDTLTKFVFGLPNEQAIAFLKQYGAESVNYVTETTRAQLKDVLSDSFEEGVAVTEVSQRIKEKFAQMETGRAETIARTETLSAVSAGREHKRQEFQKQFPDKQLKKMWVSAQDDRVRDSHEEVDGEVVDANDEFSNGLKYPREKGGEPSEVINCRCTDITFDASQEDSITDTLAPDDEDDNA